MSKYVLKYSVLIIAIYLWLQAYSPFVYKEIGGKLGLFPDDYRYGDLYRLSLLPQFKERAYECPHETIPNSERENIHLFIDRKSTRLNSSHVSQSRMPSCA